MGEAGRLRVVHIITNLAVGGASETAIAHCKLSDQSRVRASILCGPVPQGQADLVQSAIASGVHVDILPELRHAVNPFSDWHAGNMLVKWLRLNPCDVVHTHGSKAGIIGRMAARKAGVPVIVHTVHGWGHQPHMTPAVRSMLVASERRAARITDKLIAVSQTNVETGLADGIGSRNQYTVIASGIPIEKFRDVHVDRAALRQSLGIPLDVPVVGTVGRLAKQKAPMHFTAVCRKISETHPDAHFVWVGGGPLEAEFKESIAQSGLGDRMHYLGYRDDVPGLLRAFDVFALTSLWEGLPRVFPQAMCAALPIVATAVDGAAEAVEDGVTGYLVSPGDIDSQAGRICELFDNQSLRVSMGLAGLQRVFPKFSDIEMARSVEDLYFRLTAREQ